MAEVSLGEILSTKGDAENAFGGPAGGDAAVLPFAQGLAFLSHAADQKADADKFKYQEFQTNMKNYYNNFNAISIDGVAPADEKVIGKKYADVAKLIADNIGVIQNPNSNPDKYSELKQQEADLQRMIAASKMHKSYDDNTMAFTKANPDWHDLNRPKLDASLNTPTDNWKPYTLDMPVGYSPDAVAKIVAPIAQEKYAQAIASKGYITEEEGIRYKKEAWDDAWDAVHGSADSAGRSLSSAAHNAWDKLPPAAKLGSFENWYKATRDAFVPQDELTKKSIKPDDLVQSREHNSLTAREGAANRANQYKIAELGISGNTKKIGKDDIGRLYNEELTGFKTGQFSVASLQNIYGDNGTVTLKTGSKILDIKNPLNTTTVDAEVKVPKKQIVSSKLDANGNLVYSYIDYGEPAAGGVYTIKESAPVPFKQGRTDFYRIAGDDVAGKVADVAEKYRQSKKLGINPDLDELTKYFFPQDVDGSKSKDPVEEPIPIPKDTKIVKGSTKAVLNSKGQKIFTNDGGATWFDVVGTPVRNN